jgi:hypothetical protein
MLFVAEGQLSILDLVSRAYLNYLNPDVWLISGVQYMPIIGDDVSFILKAINVTGACLYPFALALLLPVFLYAIVLEKEVPTPTILGTPITNDEDEWNAHV